MRIIGFEIFRSLALATIAASGLATAAQAQATPDKWCAWYRLSHASAATLEVLPASFPACGGTLAQKPNGYTLWVWCAAAGCGSAKQALHEHYIATKQVPDWRGQVR